MAEEIQTTEVTKNTISNQYTYYYFYSDINHPMNVDSFAKNFILNI